MAVQHSLWFMAQILNDLKVFKFRADAGETVNQMGGVVLIGLGILAAIVGWIMYIRRRRKLRSIGAHREEARLRLLLTELNLGSTEVGQLQVLAGSERPAALVPLLEARSLFEDAVARFREANPGHPALRMVGPLRQRLEYGFSNNRNPFVDTRMLAPGIRMRARIRLPSRKISFLTILVGVNERQFIIRPPKAKGKPVDLSGIKELSFRVSRENDAEYEFTTQVLGQLRDGNRAVLLAHTKAISRMLFRTAERIETALPVQLYIIRQEYTSDRSIAHFKVIDSQFVIDGILRDLSIGGALAEAKGGQDQLHDGDIVVFQLPGAQIRDDLVSQVTGMLPLDEGDAFQIHLQFQGMKELNRLKLSKFLEGLKAHGFPPPIGSPSGDAPSPSESPPREA